MDDLATPITITIGGDFCPAGRVERELLSQRHDPEWLVGALAGLFHRSDLAILNLECPLTRAATRIPKVGPSLRSDPETVRLLEHLGIGLVTLANNHIRDFGDEGVYDTLRLCAASGIDTVGAGMTLPEARRIHYRTMRTRRLAVINVAEKEFGNADDSRAGANPLDIVDLLTDIQEARRHADHVLLFLHGGLEATHYPSPQSVKLLRFLAEQGLTAVIRHHGHYVQAYEDWKGVPIFYGLGNLLFDGPRDALDTGWFDTVLLTLSLAADGTCSWKLHPARQCWSEPRLRLADAAYGVALLTRLEKLSDVLSSSRALNSAWTNVLDSRAREYYALLTMPNSAALRLASRVPLLSRLCLPAWKRLVYANLLGCDTHREVLLSLLERQAKS